MLLKLGYALGVWIIVTIVLYLLGGLMVTIAQPTVVQIGAFLRDNSALIGFVAGVVYFIFGGGWVARRP